jgi:acetyl esterase
MQYSIVAFLPVWIYADDGAARASPTWEEIVEQHLPRRQIVDRSRLLPELRLMLEEADRVGAKPVEAQTPQEARASSELRIGGHWGAKDRLDTIDTFTIRGVGGPIPVRLYGSPASANTILFFHGGGWVVGSLETHDGALRALCLAAKANVLSVEYRKAPEAPFPASLEDAETALDWLRTNGAARGLDGSRLIVAGDSAGASIAAALAVRARNRDIAFLGHVLVYPATDLANTSESQKQFGFGYALNKTSLDWFAGHYLAGGVSASDPEISPLFMQDLANLPPTYLVTADHDPLRDEGRAYAQRLIAAGNDVTYEEWRGTVHGFMLMDRTSPVARRLIGRMAAWCNAIWNR